MRNPLRVPKGAQVHMSYTLHLHGAPAAPARQQQHPTAKGAKRQAREGEGGRRKAATSLECIIEVSSSGAGSSTSNGTANGTGLSGTPKFGSGGVAPQSVHSATVQLGESLNCTQGAPMTHLTKQLCRSAVCAWLVCCSLEGLLQHRCHCIHLPECECQCGCGCID